MISGATFSPCRKYRYTLWRIWDESKDVLGYCMLNPSTADENTNDPTIERCKRRAEIMGYGGIVVFNIFAYRATDPKELKKVEDPVGPENIFWIASISKDCETVICGWGRHGSLNRQGKIIKRKLISWLGNYRVRALKINKDGSPAHPLYIGYDVKPIPIDFKG